MLGHRTQKSDIGLHSKIANVSQTIPSEVLKPNVYLFPLPCTDHSHSNLHPFLSYLHGKGPETQSQCRSYWQQRYLLLVFGFNVTTFTYYVVIGLVRYVHGPYHQRMP